MTTLLAVDDSVTMRKVLEITFAGEDYRHLSASSGDAALEIVRRDKPDIVILDISLPGADGYAVCASIKAANPRGFVVLLSSKQVAYDAARGTAAGADDYADKPFDTQQFIDKVKKVLAGQPAVSTVAAPAPAAAPPAAPPPAPTAAARPAAPPPAPTPVPAPRPVAPAAIASAAPSPFAQSTQLFGSDSPVRPGGPGPGPAPGPANNPAFSGASTSSRTEPSMEHALARPAAGAAPVAGAGGAAGAAQIASATAALGPRLSGLGLDAAQVEAVMALSREVVERIVWEIVPTLAETIIKEEVRRLTAE